MTNPTTHMMQTAINYLKAEPVCGAQRYEYRDDATGCLYQSPATDLPDLGRRLLAQEPDAYSLWCAATSAEKVRDMVEAEAEALASIAREQGATEEYRLQSGDIESLASALGRPPTREETAQLLTAMRAWLPASEDESGWDDEEDDNDSY